MKYLLHIMKFYIFLFSAFYYFVNATCEPNGKKTRSLPVVDALISRLQHQRWDPPDGDCLKATLDMLNGVKNNTLWATWVWDSMQLPTGSLYGGQTYIGSYDQCLQAQWSAENHPGFRSRYCLVHLEGPFLKQTKTHDPFDDTENYYRTPTADDRPFNQHYFGACLPSICSTSAIANISQHLLRLSHLPDGVVTLDPKNCQTAGEEVEYPAGFYMFWLLVGILFITTIVSTLCNNEATNQTALGTITSSFCAKRNYKSLFTVSRDEVRVMHGMRFLTAALIVMCHESFVSMFVPNSLDMNKVMTSRLGLTCMHLEIVTDTFFTMSGLLLVRGLMMGKQKNIFYSLAKRYLRLIGPFALSIMFYTTTAKYMTSGPLWRELIDGEAVPCEQYWWKSLLMANTDVETLCHTVSWYVACDYQLAILGSCLFFLFKKNRKLGVTAMVSVAVTLTLNLGFTVYSRQLEILPFSFKIMNLGRGSTDLNYTYLSSHVRAGPYLLGMVMGYIIRAYKPALHRNIIGKDWSVIITTVSLLVGMTAFSVGGIFAGRPYDALEAAVVVATNRVFWGLMICCLIGVCEYGSLTVIPSILSWPGFVPLSKLSYCIYLIHPILLQLQKYATRTPNIFSVYNMTLNELGILVVSCGLSLAVYLLVEAPFINLSNALFTVKSKQEQNGTKAEVNQTVNGTTVHQEENGHKIKLS